MGHGCKMLQLLKTRELPPHRSISFFWTVLLKYGVSRVQEFFQMPLTMILQTPTHSSAGL
jgi:hypothetical protein